MHLCSAFDMHKVTRHSVYRAPCETRRCRFRLRESLSFVILSYDFYLFAHCLSIFNWIFWWVYLGRSL